MAASSLLAGGHATVSGYLLLDAVNGVSWHCKSIGGILIMLDLLDLDIC